MIKQNKDGSWLAKCDICQWKTTESERKDAKNKLSNHINIVHKEGVKNINKKDLTVPPVKMPPNIPSPIKEK